MTISYNRNIIDIESSSLNTHSYPIEIALKNNQDEIFSVLIKPCKHWHDWNKNSEAIHGISQQQLMDEGISINNACEMINDLSQGQIFFSDYWIRDSQWLNTLFSHSKFTMHMQCLPFEYFMSENTLTGWQQHKNRSAKALSLQPHRAVNDVNIIQHALDQLAAKGEITAVSKPVVQTPNRRQLSSIVSIDSFSQAVTNRSSLLLPTAN